MKLTSLTGIILLGASSIAFANPYAGGSVGETDYDTDGIKNPTGYELYVGTTFTENFAAEIGYNDFGTGKDKYGIGAEVSGDSVGLAAKVMIPVGDMLNLYARAGMHAWSFDAKIPFYGKDSQDGSDPFYGIGATVKLNEMFGLGLRFTKFEVDDGDFTVTALNGELYF